MGADEVREFIRKGGDTSKRKVFLFSSLSEATKKEIARNYKSGMTFHELSEKYGIHWNTIRTNLIKMGILPRRTWKSRSIAKELQQKGE